MRTGFHTNAFVWAGVNDMEAIAAFAGETGFDFLEVGPGIELDRAAFRRAARNAGISYEAFIYCRNFIDDDGAAAARERAELCRRSGRKAHDLLHGHQPGAVASGERRLQSAAEP